MELHPNQPNAHHNLGLTLLSQQKWQEGWEEYEWRPSNPRNSANGIPAPIPSMDNLLNQNVIVVGEQGIGDQIMMMRFLPKLAERCRSLVVKVETRLINLFKHTLSNEIQIEDKKNYIKTTNSPNTLFIGSGSLPLLLGDSTSADPTGIPPIQLKPDPNLVHRWAEQLKPIAKGRPIIGLGWLGGTSNEQQRERGLTREVIQDLVANKEKRWVDLQHLSPRCQHLRSSPEGT